MAARLKELFTPRAAGSNVLLSCHGITCRVFGTTVPVSALPGEEALTFTAHLPDGQDRGLIAVAVHHQFNGHKVWGGYIIELTRAKSGLVHVDLDHPWVPKGAQIVQIDHLGLHLTDVASGHRFTTSEILARQHKLRHVPDGNLFMRCLAGTATLDDVRAAATARVEEKSACERLAEIEPRTRDLEARVDDLGRENDRLREIERLARAVRDAIQTSGQRDLQHVMFGAVYSPLFAALGEPQT